MTSTSSRRLESLWCETRNLTNEPEKKIGREREKVRMRIATPTLMKSSLERKELQLGISKRSSRLKKGPREF